MFSKSILNSFLIFLILTIILRFFGLFPSVIDHDESTYFVIGQGIANGKTLYVDLIDIKPPGIFFIYAGIIKIFGNSIMAIRVFAILLIALTALLIYLIKEVMLPDKKSSLAAGIIYIVFVSTWSFYGSSVNTEIFFNFFTALGVYILIKNQKLLNHLTGGFIFGLGFTIKYIVLFDFAAVHVYLLICAIILKKQNILLNLLHSFVSFISMLIPFAIINLIWFSKGYFDQFYYISYIAPGNYVVQWDFLRLIKFIGDFHLRFLPLIFFFYYVLINKKSIPVDKKTIKILMLLWIIFDFTAILLPGNDFAHYFIQMMLPISIFGGYFFSNTLRKPRFLRINIKKSVALGLISLFVIIIVFNQKKDYYDKIDYPEIIADYLHTEMTSDNMIYTSNYQHIIYFLLGKASPTKYVHRTLLFNERHIKALNINTQEEFHTIIQLEPDYIIAKEPFNHKLLKPFIQTKYSVDTVFDKHIFVYKKTKD
jgi:4-amino-4-deoxy-L-arabinose transferase-like glycosyltransferase